MAKLKKSQKETILKNFKAPIRQGRKEPFVLFGFISKGGKDGDAPKLSEFCLNMSGCHANTDAIQNYLTKNYEILDFYFPKLESADGKYYTGLKGDFSFEPLRGFVERAISGDTIKEVITEKEALATEVEELKAELEKRKKGKKKDVKQDEGISGQATL